MKCFIITPIGKETDTETKYILESIRKEVYPELKMLRFDKIVDSSEINESGMITTQIRDHILCDDLVIANLTGMNPNVMYELGARHSTGRPVVHICKKGVTLPFDIKDVRTIFFDMDVLSFNRFKELLFV